MSIFFDYKKSINFFYPVVILLVLTIVISLHSRKFKYTEINNAIKKEDIYIPETVFTNEYNMLTSKKYSEYLFKMKGEASNLNATVKKFFKLLNLYKKYEVKYNNGPKIFRKHYMELREKYLKEILDVYDQLKDMKMNIIDDEVFKEWKQKLH